jgi:head-tail adaptor
MTPAGEMKRRLRFEMRTGPVDDGYGNTVAGSWTSQFTVAAAVKYLLGSETVLAARLEGRQPAVITVRTSTNSKRITHEWRAVDTRSGAVYALKEPPRDAGLGFLEMLAELGVAA